MGYAMRVVNVKLPDDLVDLIDELVRLGKYSSRSEFIRFAIADKLQKEFNGQLQINYKKLRTPSYLKRRNL